MVNVGILVCNQFLFVVVCCCLLLNVRSATCDEALSPRLSVFFPAFVIQLVGGFWFFGVLHLYLHPTLHPFSTHFPSIFLGFHRPLSGRWLIGSFCPAAFFGGFWWCWLCFCCRCCSAAFVAVWPAVKRNICIQFVYSFMAGKVPHSDFRDGTMNINTEINGKLKSFEPDFLSLSI